MLSGLAISAASARRTGSNFKAITYTAKNIAKAVSGVGFKPDLIITKDRVNDNICLLSGYYLNPFTPAPYETVIGEGLNINVNPAVLGNTSPGPVQSAFDDGFNISNVDSVCKTAVSDDNFAAWCWKRNPDTFQILNWTGNGAGGRNIPHGLSSAPKMIWAVRPSGIGSDGPFVYHSANTGAPETDYLKLNSEQATTDDNTIWDDTAPDGTNIRVGSALNVNSYFYNAWVFAEKKGETKFGSYTGNGSTSGPVVDNLGFNPQMVLIKRVAGNGHWNIYDTRRRNGGNTENWWLTLSLNWHEYSGVNVNLGHDKFTVKSSDNLLNANGETYIYAAFA